MRALRGFVRAGRDKRGRSIAKALVGILLALSAVLSVMAPLAGMPHPPVANAGQAGAGFSRLGFPPASTPRGLHFDYLLTIVLENKGICDILTSCGGTAPYLTALANGSGLATNYEQCSVPSLPNYLCLTAADTFGCTTNAAPHSNACTNATWVSPNIADRLEDANLTWKAYIEDMPANCYGKNSGLYAVKHNPFVYYGDIVDNATRCTRVVPSGPSNQALLDDLNSTANASNYMWFTPNLCNDMHDCTVASGDAFMATLVPTILNSTVFKSERAALLILFDEASGGRGAPNLFTVWSGRVVTPGFVSAVAYGHFSALKTIETNWELPAIGANDSAAASMDEFFYGPPTARFSYGPMWPRGNDTVTFDASASSSAIGWNATLEYRWDWTDDGTWDTPWSNASIEPHAFRAAGMYAVALEVRDALGSVGNATLEVPVDDVPPATEATLEGPAGPSGWYRGNVTTTLNATDDRSGVASTQYAVDGSPPQAYAAPFMIGGEGNHTVEYAATDQAGNAEANRSVAFAIDSILPTTTATFAGVMNGSEFVVPITVTLLAADLGSGLALTRYNTDDGPWTNYTEPFLVDNTGSHTVQYDSADVAGNLEPTNAFMVVNGTIEGIEGVRSQVSFNGTAGSVDWYTSPVNVTLELVNGTSPPNSLWYRLDGGAWTAYTTPFLIAGDGVHELDYNATNAVGNPEVTHRVMIRIDTTAPAADSAIDGTLGRNGWYRSDVTVTLNATDLGSGVATISYRVDQGTWQYYDGPITLGEGDHTVEYAATDLAGLQGPDNLLQIRIDVTAPVTTDTILGFLGAQGWYVTDVTVRLTAVDAGSGVESTQYRLNGGVWVIYAGPILISAGGRYVLEFLSVDRAGNPNPVQSLSIDIEKSLPYFIHLGPSVKVTPSPVEISWIAKDNDSGIAGYAVRVDDGPFEPVGNATSVTLNLSEGTHVIQVRATDAAGNVAVRELIFLVTSTPTVETVSPVRTQLFLVMLIAACGAAAFAILALGRARREQ